MPFPDTLLFVSNPPTVLSNRTDTSRRYTSFPLTPIHRQPRLQISTASTLSDEEQTFLSLPLVSRAVYEEAMPLFYFENLLRRLIRHMDSYLVPEGIGARRRKHIRRLSVEFSSSSICQNVGGGRDMQLFVDQLVDAERVETLDIVCRKCLRMTSEMTSGIRYADSPGRVPVAHPVLVLRCTWDLNNCIDWNCLDRFG